MCLRRLGYKEAGGITSGQGLKAFAGLEFRGFMVEGLGLGEFVVELAFRVDLGCLFPLVNLAFPTSFFILLSSGYLHTKAMKDSPAESL